MTSEKENSNTTFTGLNTEGNMKINITNDNIRADNAIVQKVAAGLKIQKTANELDEKCAASPGGGSLSSGCSIVTIASVSNSEPDPDYPNGPDGNPEKKHSSLNEKWYETTLQVSVPFFIAGIGTIGAGLVLAEVQNWPVFKTISQLFILVPALLGLKGNLDMCLASRLCTQANLGNMNSYREIAKMIIGNLALVQIQSIVASTLVALFAITVSAAMDGKYSWDHSLLMIASSVCTATSSCFILDFVMIAVIMLSHRCKMNPDNLATPLAASIGDVVSISVLSAIASSFFIKLESEIWILYLIIVIYLVLLPFWIYIVLHNKYTRNVLTSGWVPVISALFISGLGGLVLDQAVDVLNGFVIFQPIINGIGGNLVSVQASRISTMLHQTSLMGIIPPHTKLCVSPWKALIKGVPSAKSARILISMSIPGHLVFIFAADYFKHGHSTIHFSFALSYLLVACLQVMLLLYVAHIIVHAMWRFKIDPDNSAIPYLTALGDLSGSIFLGVAMYFLMSIGRQYGG
ncbi:solute carrier family 41 member 1-like [Leptopilina boulardi]|uniref:solute carrier family 41 member 1-like n=1 Tax=Leptopilina boulardi TaxID=63433 RepID=UPI0021F68CAC|nr:solute carrier family 41 member 1-like [Leptopilina boulardi]XP_051171834.1 solute carrier family 41 member 1-like [Leptopilina boulardi]XP_051171835.1 solute carrier family 41 member 1-like [Leptopilina boulardi]XP_051171836.1 solute carrier family 41 member 1-like [Leptopilina boulardi]